MACLETTFLMDLLRGKENVKAIKDELSKTESNLTIASPSIAELWSGACLADISNREKEKVNEMIDSLEVFSLDLKSAKEAGEIEADLIKKGISIETEDIMIAGIAKVNGEKIVTRDEHYLNISGLKIFKY